MSFSRRDKVSRWSHARFKLGAFEIAKKQKAPILPIVIKGTANALPKGGIELQGKHPMA